MMISNFHQIHTASLRIVKVAGIAVATALCGITALAQTSPSHPCGDPFKNHFGPWDYRTASKGNLKMVEGAHFTPGVETMTRPSKTMMSTMAQDVAYTLGVFPNHPRALLTMAKLSEKYKVDPAPAGTYTVDCWFDRAVRFRPDDTVVRSLYAQYLGKHGRKNEAIQHLEFAIKQAADNPMSQYNIGMVFFELGEFDRALAQAHKATSMGMQWPELEKLLKASGHWKPAATESAEPSSN